MLNPVGSRRENREQIFVAASWLARELAVDKLEAKRDWGDARDYVRPCT